jgi:hypothetical protein
MNRYTVFKQTGTHADVLAVIGAADLLRHLDPRIVEREDRFEIRFRKRLTAADLDTVEPGFSYLDRPRDETPSLPPERIRNQGDSSNADGVANFSSTPENRMYAILGRMKAHAGPNKLVSGFARMRRQEWSKSVWDSLHGRLGFAFSTPLVQLFNPQSGKGYALLKPSGTSRRDKTKDRWAEPFLEWLRYRGYFSAAAGWFASGDLRLYCPVPSGIAYDRFAVIAAAFREFRLGGTAVKMDCRAVLGLARLLVQNADPLRPPRRAIRGIQVTHYQDMGQAHTLMAMEQLAIPDWFDLSTPRDAELWLETLEEHDTILRRLTDSHSDEFALLKQYRRTFQTRWQESIAEFIRFLADYGQLLFKRRARDHWLLPQFGAAGVTRILERDPDLRSMLANPGFIAIAAAIRGSTLGAQAARHNFRMDHREIRYGLLRDIRRADASGRPKLLEQITAFIGAFNSEGLARRAAGLRAMQIQSGELDAFAELLQRLPVHVPVGSLLCGFAACRPAAALALDAERQWIQAASA